jgi:prevent-host-death family protein
MIVNIHAAKTNLSKLIERAEAGEEVIIARAGSPRVRLTPIEPQSQEPAPKREKGAWIGSLKGQFWIAPDFDDVDEEIARAFEESEIFPPEDKTS